LIPFPARKGLQGHAKGARHAACTVRPNMNYQKYCIVVISIRHVDMRKKVGKKKAAE